MSARALVSVFACLAGCSATSRVCDLTGPPPPSFACTAQLEGAIVCTSGSGYTCAHEGCWALVLDGPCAPGGGTDGGPDAGSDAGTGDAGPCGLAPTCAPVDEGSERCTAATRERCVAGCWTSVGVCFDGGVFVCSPAGSVPVDACTTEFERVAICPGGTYSGFGYSCSTAGCWNLFLDGLCSNSYGDGGQCFGAPRCSTGELGQERCENRVRQRCGGPGCWTNVGLCPRDGG